MPYFYSPQFLYANIANKIDSVPPVVTIPMLSFSYPNNSPVILITSASIYLVAGHKSACIGFEYKKCLQKS